jgi:hypothetical protein
MGDKNQTKWSSSYFLKYSHNETLVENSTAFNVSTTTTPYCTVNNVLKTNDLTLPWNERYREGTMSDLIRVFNYDKRCLRWLQPCGLVAVVAPRGSWGATDPPSGN